MSNSSRESQFALNQLGWYAFQQLCGTVLAEILGQTYQVFSAGHDRGRDGAFIGTWEGRGWSGTFTVQSKHVSGERRPLRLSDIEGETAKIERLARDGLADTYLLMTNATVTGARAEGIEKAIRAAGAGRAVVYGAEWIEEKIRDSPRLRALVPRLYGLGDLSHILDERAYEQAEAIIQTMSADLGRFVPTASYRTAVEAFEKHRFVMLVGEPAAGKSTIAYTLALYAADAQAARPVEATGLEAIKAHWNTNEPQVFILDDVFGATQYRSDRSDDWNRHTRTLEACLRNCWVICTSRDYVYRQARDDLKRAAFPLLEESQVVVDVEALTAEEKVQILYNHIKMGDQAPSFRRRLKPFLSSVAAHPSFRPEAARRLGTARFTQDLDLTPAAIEGFVDEQRDFLIETIQGMGQRDRATLVLLFSNGGELPSPVTRDSVDRRLADRLGTKLADVRESLADLQDSFVRLASAETERAWRFRHPTLRDAVGHLIREDPELLDVYLQQAPLEFMLREVTCGVSDVPGAELVVPDGLSTLVADRLVEELRAIQQLDWRETWRRVRAIYGFLANRCSTDFLSHFIALSPGFIERIIAVGPYLEAAPQPGVVAALARHGLLDEESRAKYVGTIADLAVEIPDPGWHSVRNIREFLSESEREMILARVRDELVPRLSAVVSDLCSEERDHATTEEDFSYGISQRMSEMTEFAEAFDSDNESQAAFAAAADSLDQLADGVIADGVFPAESTDDTAPPSWTMPPRAPATSGFGLSDIFDDVDL